MTERRWKDITIRYDDGEVVLIGRHELERIENIGDVIEALNWARTLTIKLGWILQGRADEKR